MVAFFLLLSCRPPEPPAAGVEVVRTHSPSPAAEAAQHEQACEAGDFVACHAAALDHYYGPASAAADGAALSRFRKACDGGYAPSCNGLGAMYAEGRGVAVDEGEAARWYRSSCEMGASTGCQHLATALEAGAGVPVDAAAAQRARARGECLADPARTDCPSL